MLRWLAALLLVPLADALLLVVLAGFLDWKVVVALVVLTALVGMLLVRAEGRHTLRKIQRRAERGEPPTNELVDGGLLLVAGAFLLTPGLVTDALGFLFVLPPSRYVVRTLLKRYVLVPMIDERTGGFATGDVYVGGFPDESGWRAGFSAGTGPDGGGSGGRGGPRDGGGPPGGESGPGGDSGDTVDLGPDDYDVESDGDR